MAVKLGEISRRLENTGENFEVCRMPQQCWVFCLFVFVSNPAKWQFNQQAGFWGNLKKLKNYDMIVVTKWMKRENEEEMD